jgi:hypothetical protein
MLKLWNIHSVLSANHISPEKTSISVRIQKTLLGNSWWNYSAGELIIKFVERHLLKYLYCSVSNTRTEAEHFILILIQIIIMMI